MCHLCGLFVHLQGTYSATPLLHKWRCTPYSKSRSAHFYGSANKLSQLKPNITKVRGVYTMYKKDENTALGDDTEK
jgi:hypothetical protein